MPRAILAIRSYPATMLLALCVFLLTLAITTGSLGTVRGGGDDGDGGSGMGGTGKSGEFGGSGFGGTGAPSPFFGLLDTDPSGADTDNEPQHLEAPQPSSLVGIEETAVAVYEAPIHSPARASTNNVQDSLVTDSTRSVPLTDAIQESLDNHLLAEDVPSSLAQPLTSPDLANDAANRPEARLAFGAAEPIAIESAPTSNEEVISATARSVESQREEQEPLTSQSLQQLAEANAPANTTDEDSNSQSVDRSNLPERIQRPELPPFQRVTPVQRPTLMPPRVQPMRI